MPDQAPQTNQLPPARSRLLVAGVLAILLALAAFGVWNSVLRPNLFPKNFGTVEPGKVFRSGWLTPHATRLVHERHHIKTIVDLGGFDKRPTDERTAQRTAQALGIERFAFRLEGDGTGNPNIYAAALRLINDPARQPVLIHCSAGAERTGGCVVLQRVIEEGQTLDQAYPETLQFGHNPARNPKLRPYLDQWAAKIAESVRTGTPIPGMDPATPVNRPEPAGD